VANALSRARALAPAAADAQMICLLRQPQVHLRRVPGLPGRAALRQLIARTFADVAVVQARSGAGQVDLAATAAALPVRRSLAGFHLLVDLMPTPAHVVHDDRLRDSSVLLGSLQPEALA
jgi:acetoacetate decarboxylase